MQIASSKLNLPTLGGYLAVAAVLSAAWSVRDQHLIRAEEGLGYWLGIAGGTLMLLLLVYPLRKRLRLLSSLGSVRFWFNTHMIFGILGPVLVLLHSNFTLGSPNARLALFATLIVAGSGVLGRYLYGKIHHGMHGQRATLESLRANLNPEASEPDGLRLAALIHGHLAPHEQAALDRSRRLLPSILGVFLAPLTARRLRRRLDRELCELLDHHASRSGTVAAHRARLLETARAYMNRRLETFCKLAQLKGCERLFGLWHVVHFPLFLVMLAAALLHVVAVHVY